jgi:hypothetical protein
VRLATNMAGLKPGFAQSRWSRDLGTVIGRHKQNPNVFDVDYKGKRVIVNVDYRGARAPQQAGPQPSSGGAVAARGQKKDRKKGRVKGSERIVMLVSI